MAKKQNNIEIGIETFIDPTTEKTFKDISKLIENIGTGQAKKALDSLFVGINKDAKNLSNQIDVLNKKFGSNVPTESIGKLNTMMNRLKIDGGQVVKWLTQIQNMKLEGLGDIEKFDTLSKKILNKTKIIEANREELKHNIELVKLETKQTAEIEKQSKKLEEKQNKTKEYSKILSDVATKYNTHYKVIAGISAQEALIANKKKELHKLDGQALDIAKKELDLEEKKLKALNQMANAQKGTWRDAIANAFSLEKVVNRMAFVITAKLSYEAFDAFTRFFREGIDNAIKLEQHLTRIMSITRGQNQATLRQSSISALGMGFNVQDVTQSMYESASAQFTNKETARLMDESSKMAVAGFTSQTEAMQALTSVIRAYNLDTNDATRVADWFFKVIELGRTELKDLAPEIGKVSATANLLGIGMEEVGTAIATMTMQGIKTNVAITSLNQLFMNMANPTKEAKEILEKYGLTLDLAQVKAQGLAKTVQQLNVLTDEEITTIASSKQGFRALAVALNDNAQWQDNYNRIVQSGGSTQRAFQEQTETTAFKLAKMRGEIMKLGIEFGEVLIKFSPLITGLQNIVQGISGSFMAWTSIIGGLSALFTLKLMPAIKDFILLLNNPLTKSLAMTQLGFGALGVAIIAVSFAIGAYKKKQEELAEFERQRHNEKIDELNGEKRALEDEAKLLNTYAGLKEKEASKDGISRREKVLLANVQDVLAEKYNYSSKQLADYNKLIDLNSQKQKENFEATKQATLNQMSPEYLKSAQRLINRESNKFTSAQARDFDVQKGYGMRPYSTGTEFVSEFGKIAELNRVSSPEMTLGRIYNAKKKYQDELTKYSKMGVDGIKQQKAFLSSTKDAYNDLLKIEDYLIVEKQKFTIVKEKESRIDLSASDLETKTRYTQDKLSKAQYETEKNLYQLSGKNLTELINAKNAYLQAMVSEKIPLEIRERELTEMNNEILQLVNKNYKDLINNELNLLNEKEKKESDIISAYEKIDWIYAREIQALKKVNASADLINKVQSERIDAKNDKQVMLDKIKYTRELQKLEEELARIEIGKPNSIIDTFLGRKRTPEQIRDEKLGAINASGVPESVKQEQRGKVTEEFNKSIVAKKEEENQMTIDQSKQLASNLLNIWDDYTNQRIAQIEREKQARMDSIDQQAKLEYRSSWWIAKEKEKSEKKADEERKKYAKLRKATALSETTVNFATAMVKLWGQLGAGALLLKPLLIANYLTSMAMISRQKFGKGGIVFGRSHQQGGVPVELEGEEVVFSKKASSGRQQTLSNINSSLNRGESFESSIVRNVPTLTYANNQTGVSANRTNSIANKLDSVVKAISDINFNLEIHGDILSDMKLKKRVDNGSKQMVGI